MAFKDLMHWNRGKKSVPVRRSETADSSVSSLQREINHVFDRFFGEMNLAPFEGAGWLAEFDPKIDVSETESEVQVSAELPGVDEKDIEVSLSEDALMLKGERKEEHEEKRKDYFHREQTFGAFHRRIPLPAEVDADKVEASFRKGVLTVTLPKTAAARAKRIDVRTGA